jgi:SAM-dependent methyltransferase
MAENRARKRVSSLTVRSQLPTIRFVMALQTSWEQLRATWAELGAKDPLWAVVTWDEKQRGKWQPREFFLTGERDVARYHDLLKRVAGCPEKFDHILDFGCGVGRLSLAWSLRARQVTGVDISPGMIAKGREFAKSAPNVDLRLNEARDLRCFEDSRFDLVFSHICLQHVPWELTAGYLREFARVCRRGGWVAFQLPTRPLRARSSLADVRKKIVDWLPFGLNRAYRNWRRGCPVIFDMYFVPPENVIRAANQAGLTEIHREPDQSAGDSIESFVYVFEKP